MTFEHGRINTWRLPRFSAFEMDLRQSARTCGGGREWGARGFVCVCVRQPASAATSGQARAQNFGGPASASRDRVLRSTVHEWCGDGVIGRLDPPRPRLCRICSAASTLPIQAVRHRRGWKFRRSGERSFEP